MWRTLGVGFAHLASKPEVMCGNGLGTKVVMRKGVEKAGEGGHA